MCFGAYDLILRFHENASISIYSSIGIGKSVENLGRHSAFEEASRELLQLLNMTVVDVSWKSDGTITLVFDEGATVEIYDDNVGYESYTVSGPHGLLVV